jgi:MFS family permease
MSIGTFLAPLLVGPFSSKFGRKPGLWAATVLIYIAAGLQIGTTSKGVLYLARFLMGKVIIK